MREEVMPGVPLILPATWRLVGSFGRYGCSYYNNARKLGVIVSACIERDGKRWLHVSASHRERIPTWDELRDIKDIFIGRAALALQVLPPKEEYVNCDPRVLHLWCCMDGRPVPDFRTEAGLI